MAIEWGQRAKFILNRIETQIRCLMGEVAFVPITERQDKLLAPLIRAHHASDQNLNTTYSEELDCVVIMSHEPRCVALVSQNGRIEVIKEHSEYPLAIISDAPIGGLFA